MKTMQIVIDGVSKEQFQRDIERAMKGWKLFFHASESSTFQFSNPFFGYSWDGTAEHLKKIISNFGVNKETKRVRPMILVFQWNGENRFAWCSWEKVLYDFNTKTKHSIEPKFSVNITNKIIDICGDSYIDTMLNTNY